jgi:hypothetical protein
MIRKPTAAFWRAAGAAALACMLSAACGGDGGASTPVAGTAAPLAAGGVTGETAIVAAPAAGPCAASGTQALPSPSLNSKLDCAP